MLVQRQEEFKILEEFALRDKNLLLNLKSSMMKKAFTMIELIFTLVVIGILVAIALPKLMATRDDAKISAMAYNVAMIADEIGGYAVSQAKIENDFSKMSNIAATLKNTGEAIQTGDILKIKMNSIDDCLQLQLLSSATNITLKLIYGNPGTDGLCRVLQELINAKDYDLQLLGMKAKR